MIPDAAAKMHANGLETATRWTIGEAMAQARIAGVAVGRAEARFDRLRDEWNRESVRLEERRQEALGRVDELTNANDELEMRLEDQAAELEQLRAAVRELGHGDGDGDSKPPGWPPGELSEIEREGRASVVGETVAASPELLARVAANYTRITGIPRPTGASGAKFDELVRLVAEGHVEAVDFVDEKRGTIQITREQLLEDPEAPTE